MFSREKKVFFSLEKEKSLGTRMAYTPPLLKKI
jgi:GH18 family chitinase